MKPENLYALMACAILLVTTGRTMGAGGTAEPRDPAPKPNLLLVLSDDHSAPHLGCYGTADIKTPHLDRFASEGMRFDRAYVACPQCVPSRATFMTGRSPVCSDTSSSGPFPAASIGRV